MPGAVTDHERLMTIANELAEAASSNGRRRLPVVQPREAAGLVALMAEQLDAAIEQRAADAIKRELSIACARGCNACCTTPVVIGPHEAIAIAEWLREPAHAEIRAQFEAAYPAWRARLGGVVEALVGAQSEEAQIAAGTAYRAHGAMCPFNNAEGDCTIYPARPALCRTSHALWTAARCADNDGVIDYYAHEGVEQTYAAQQGVRTILDEAIDAERGPELLPKAVLHLIAPATGRNDDCVCGSGLKSKKCCS